MSLAITGGVVLASCTSPPTTPPTPPGNILLVQGTKVQLQTGEYSYTLHDCADSDLLDLRGGNNVLSIGVFTTNTVSPQEGTAWLQAGTYSGKALYSPLPLCPGLCLPPDFGAHEVTPCGWSIKLRLVHAGTH